MNKKIIQSIGIVMAVFLMFKEGYGQTKGNLLNVKDYEAVGDGKTDDTAAIQEAISKASEGDTVFIPEGAYLVRTLGLKSGIRIKGEGMLIQRINDEPESFTDSKQNSSNPLFRGHKIADVFLSFRAQTMNEAIYLSGSKDIRIHQSVLLGDATKVQPFAGVLLYDCENVSIERSTIRYYGESRREPDRYQSGTAIRVLSSRGIQINNNKILQNGENGIFLHDTPDVEAMENTINNNGMSAIQVAFGTLGREKNYRFVNNVMEGNAADAIDINNRSDRGFWDINCHIEGNISRKNGFVKGLSTPDGSGVATLINVSGVTMLNNLSEGNNRPSLYIENCGKIYASGNKADNQIEVVLQFDELIFEDNSFSSVSLLANVDGKKLILNNNSFYSMSLPNGIKVDSLILTNNLISQAALNFNMTGNVRMKQNTINSHSKDGALLIVKVTSALLEQNIITSMNSPAILTRKTAENVNVINNEIKSVNSCIYDDGAKKLRVIGNRFLSLKGGSYRHTVVSKNPDNLLLSANEHETDEKEIAIYLEGPGTARITEEKIIHGSVDYGTVDILKSSR